MEGRNLTGCNSPKGKSWGKIFLIPIQATCFCEYSMKMFFCYVFFNSNVAYSAAKHKSLCLMNWCSFHGFIHSNHDSAQKSKHQIFMLQYCNNKTTTTGLRNPKTYRRAFSTLCLLVLFKGPRKLKTCDISNALQHNVFIQTWHKKLFPP